MPVVAAAGPSGMTSEHLKSILENVRDCELLFSSLFNSSLVPGFPQDSGSTLSGTIEAQWGGVLSWQGNVFRRLFARTIA